MQCMIDVRHLLMLAAKNIRENRPTQFAKFAKYIRAGQNLMIYSNDIRNLYINREVLTCASEYFITLMNVDYTDCIVKLL